MFLHLRCLVVWLSMSATTAGTSAWSMTAVRPATQFDEALTSAAALALTGCAAWAWCVSTVVVLGAVRRPAAGRGVRGVPRWLVAVLLAACGAAVATAAPAGAADRVETEPGVSVDGLPFPDRAVGPARARTADPAPVPPRRDGHVVRPGDSLWRIATARLPLGASDAEVAAATAVLHDLNREAVGPDPDLIHPGLHLRMPGPREESA